MSVFYFNRMPVSGPWGGGNKTITSLAERLTSMGHTVTGELRSNVDVIFCVDPRPSQNALGYSALRSIADQLSIPLIQRVGDVGTHGKPDLTQLVKQSIARSDFVIFTSHWAMSYVGWRGRCDIIQNGAMPAFYENRRGISRCSSTPSIVTHHWSSNPLKGISLYERLAADIERGAVDAKFTYIGRSSDALASRTMTPRDTDELSVIIPQHEIYLSASVLEAGANHIVEAMACGLPVIYSSEGGSIPEYCDGRGLSYSTYDEMIETIRLAKDQYDRIQAESLTYVRTMDDVVDEYVEVLCRN